MTSDLIQQLSPVDKASLRRFVPLERQLLQKYPLYVSNFDNDVTTQLSGRSAHTRDSQIALFIAGSGGKDVARCAAIINPHYQEAKKEFVGFIGYFAAAPACVPAVAAMFKKAETWLKEQGITRVIAPFNGSAMIGYGLLTDGFDQEPVMTHGWTPPYYIDYFLQNGYNPTYPLLVYTTDFTTPEYHKALERAQASTAIKVRTINKNNWHSDLEIFRTINNEAFNPEWEWYPLSIDEYSETYTQIKPIIDPRLMLIAEIDGTPVGISIGLPIWNPLIRTCQGKLGPREYIRFLLRAGHYENGSHFIAAVKPGYDGMGIGRSLIVLLCHRYEELGLTKAYGFTINVNNVKSRRMNEAIGGTARVLYTVYDKHL